jgi:hypothetical protein
MCRPQRQGCLAADATLAARYWQQGAATATGAAIGAMAAVGAQGSQQTVVGAGVGAFCQPSIEPGRQLPHMLPQFTQPLAPAVAKPKTVTMSILRMTSLSGRERSSRNAREG